MGAARRRCGRFPKQNLGGRYWEMGILLVLRLTQVSIRKGSEWGSSSFPSHSSQLQALSPSETGRNQLQPSRHLATEPTAEAAGRHQVFFYPQGPRDSEPVLISSLSFTVPLSPRVPSRGTLSRTTPLPPWDPSYQANAGSQLVVSWGICGSVSSGRGAVRERALSNFPFSTGAQPRVSGIFVWQDTLPSFLAYV